MHWILKILICFFKGHDLYWNEKWTYIMVATCRRCGSEVEAVTKNYLVEKGLFDD